MIKNPILFIIDNNGDYLRHGGTLRAINGYREFAFVISPRPLTDSVSMSIMTNNANYNRFEQYVLPTAIKVNELIEESDALYQTIADWNVFGVEIKPTALADISNFRSGATTFSFQFQTPHPSTKCVTYKGVFGVDNPLPTTGQVLGDYYECEDWNFYLTSGTQTYTFTKGMYVYFNGSRWIKDALLVELNTSTVSIPVEPSHAVGYEIDDDDANYLASIGAAAILAQQTAEQSVQDIEDLKDGTTIVKKAEQDKNGNDIVTTYETKSDVTNKLAFKADKTYVDSQDQALDERIDTIVAGTVEGVSGAEIVDARKGELSLRAKIDKIDDENIKQDNNIFNYEGWEVNNKKRTKQAVVTFTSDDGRLGDITKLRPIFEAEGVPLVLAIAPDILEIPIETLLEVQNDLGWEMASHSMSHLNFTTITLEQVEYQLSESKKWLNERGLKCTNFCVPFGHYLASHIPLFRKHYRSARTSMRGINSLPLNTYELNSVVIAETAGAPFNTLEYYKSMVDDAFANEKWLIFLMHGYSETEITPAHLIILQELIQYIKGLNVPIMTMENALDHIGNVVDTPDFKLDASGKPTFDGNKVILTEPDSVTSASVWNDFIPNKKIFYTRITNANATGFPESKGGLLITNKIATDEYYSFQEYKVVTSGRRYYRHATGKTGWTNWYLADISTRLGVDSVNEKTLSNEFPTDKISYCRITNGNATTNGSPSGYGGLLITNRVEANGWAFQEWHTYNTETVHKRVIKNDGTFGNWFKYNMDKSLVEVLEINSVLNDTLLTSIPSNKITYAPVSNLSAAGFPEGRGGTVITNRLISDQYSAYQEYHVIYSNKSYKRKWEGTAWGTWIEYNTEPNYIVVLGVDTVSVNDGIVSFPDKKISYQSISSNYALQEGFPGTGSGGILITNRILGDNTIAYQEFHSLDKEIFTRKYAGTAWGDWKTDTVLPRTTLGRPTSNLHIGLMVFDTTLGKPIWWNGTNWVDATGTTV